MRGRGEGSITYDADRRRWIGYLSLGVVAGRRRRRKFTGLTKSKVLRAIEKARGAPRVAQEIKVEDAIADYLAAKQTAGQSPTTANKRRQHAELRIVPHLGAFRVSQVTASDIERFYGTVSEKDGAWSAKLAGVILGDFFRWAIRAGFTVTNPVVGVPKPKPVVKEIRFLSADEVRRFLAAVAGHRIAAIFTVALGTGLRQGELLGLHWRDVDLDAGILHVRRTLIRVKGAWILREPKSKSSRRQIQLPAAVVQAFRERRQLAAREKHTSEFVFPTRSGKPFQKANLLTQVFWPALERAGLPPSIRFHDLRHTHASLLISAGQSLRAVSARLGHSSAEITLRVYSHVLPGDDARLAQAANSFLTGNPSATIGKVE